MDTTQTLHSSLCLAHETNGEFGQVTPSVPNGSRSDPFPYSCPSPTMFPSSVLEFPHSPHWREGHTSLPSLSRSPLKVQTNVRWDLNGYFFSNRPHLVGHSIEHTISTRWIANPRRAHRHFPHFFGAGVNTLSIIKLKLMVLVIWSYRSPYSILTIQLGMVLISKHVVQSLLNTCLLVFILVSTPNHIPLK
jgi:hypothetical protein